MEDTDFVACYEIKVGFRDLSGDPVCFKEVLVGESNGVVNKILQ